MADQNSETPNQQTQQSNPAITGNRTRKEEGQPTSEVNADQSTDQPANNTQPKFQSKHKDRAVQPPNPSRTSSEEETDTNAAAQGSQEPMSPTQNQAEDGEQAGQATSDANQAPATDPSDQSSKLGDTQQAQGSGAGGGGVLPPESHLDSLDNKDKPPKSSPGKKKWLLTGAAVLLLLLAFGAYMAYAQYVAPKKAPFSYMQRLANMESGQYKLKLATVSGDSSSDPDTEPDINLSVEGEFVHDSENLKNSAFDSSANIKYEESFWSINQSLDFRYVNGTGYVRTDEGFAEIKANTWYSWELDQKTSGVLDKTGCSKKDRQALSDYFQNEAANKIKLTNPQRNDWFGKQRNGNRVRHYSGEIAGSSWAKLLQGAAQATSQDCSDPERIDDSDLNDMNIVYDLYTNDDRDEAVMRVFQGDEEKVKTTLITSGYNQGADISAPESSKSIKELYKYRTGQDMNSAPDLENRLDGSGSGESSPRSLSQSNLRQ
jgi:hypothetical protein